jgi:endonuclease-8
LPEGDTIFRAARTLHRALAGQVVTRFNSVLPHLLRVNDDTPIPGRIVESVRPRGKWILMTFSGDLILLTHMLMSGSWHIYRPGETWRKSRYHMRIVIETNSILAVAFNVQVAEFHTQSGLARREGFNRLGPDVLGDGFDAELAAANLGARSELEVGAALLSQSLLAGLGNVYKNEVCFACGVNPFRKVASLESRQLAQLVSTAREFLLANVTPESAFRRTTRLANVEERLWVYGRAGKPCRRCGAPIQSQKEAIGARVNFWCPVCQP